VVAAHTDIARPTDGEACTRQTAGGYCQACRNPADLQEASRQLRADWAARPAQLAEQRLDLSGDAPHMLSKRVRPAREAGDAVRPVTGHPPVHRLAGHAIPFGDLDHRDAGQSSSTALGFFWGCGRGCPRADRLEGDVVGVEDSCSCLY